MILLHDIVEVFDLPDRDRSPVRMIVALDGRFIGVTAVDGNDFRETMAAARLLQKPPRGFCVPLLGEQKVNGLAVLIHRPRQRAPLALTLM